MLTYVIFGMKDESRSTAEFYSTGALNYTVIAEI